MQKATYFHAGCTVCVSVEDGLIDMIDQNNFVIENVHLGEQKQRITEAEKLGVKSVPALAVAGQVFHINFGAAIADLK